MTDAFDVAIAIDDGYLVSEERVRQVIQAVLVHERVSSGAGLALVVTGDEQVRQLNLSYRGIDRATDVLSFALQEGDVLIGPDEAQSYLGDVIVAFPTAERQAAAAGHDVVDELTLLLVHGCLHLLGYDHADDAEQTIMWRRQREILTELGLPDLEP